MFRLTLFNGVTFAILLFTLAMAAMRWKLRLKTNWTFPYYAVAAGYSLGFDGSLNRWWVLAGAVCGVALRFVPLGGGALRAIRVAEAVFFGYAVLRLVQLLLMWPW